MIKLLSVVIPTHNRFKYAQHAILSILKLNIEIELIVSDTSNNSDLADFSNSIDLSLYPNCTYVYRYNKTAFDMAGNHNYALSLATGKYVCLIGDDDSISPYILLACKWMDKNQVSVLSQLVSANYIWPDFKTKIFGTAHAGRLYIDKNMSLLEKISCEDAFNFAMNSSAQGTDGLPKLYHGIVNREILQQIKEKSGNYVHGASPDFSAAIALCQLCDDFYQTSFPITIPGASGGSNTGRSALNKHKGSLADESQTKNGQSSWEKLIPAFFSVETVWADACFKTLRSLNCDFENKFNFYGFYALLLLNHSDRKKEIFDSFNYYISNNSHSSVSHSRLLWTCYFSAFVKKYKALAIRALHPTAARGKDFISNIENIELVPIYLKKHLEDRKVQIIFGNLNDE